MGKCPAGPQPFLRQRLREMEASLEQNSSCSLTQSQARAFNQRWGAVNAAEEQESAATSVAQKFRQLEALLTSARHLG
jgi:hypothetical protein